MVASGKLSETRFGSSGAIGRHSPRLQAFAGQGHSLRSPDIEKMPGDIPEPVGHHHHHHQVRKLQVISSLKVVLWLPWCTILSVTLILRNTYDFAWQLGLQCKNKKIWEFGFF